MTLRNDLIEKGWIKSILARMGRAVRTARKGLGGARSAPKRRPIVSPDEMREGTRTLQHLRRELRAPRTIECREVRLIGRDFEGAIIAGPGRIQLMEDREIQFSVYGEAEDGGRAFRKMIEAQNNPYDHLSQFRMQATDYRGQEWTGGYTLVEYFADANRGWPLTGELRGLSISPKEWWVSKESSVELLLVPTIDLPMGEWSETATKLRDEVIRYSRQPGCHVVEALDTEILFEVDPDDGGLWITAKTSEKLRHPQAETWLAEPLRILLGNIIYPRMTARNFGDGRAYVTLLPAPALNKPTMFGLMPPFDLNRRDDGAFWNLYTAILTMIANSGGFESHPVTRLYEELAQAARGSRWVILLTLASSAESLAKAIMDDADRKSEFSDEALQSMEAHLASWKGDEDLRRRMKSNLAMVRKRSVQGFMKQLVDKGTIERDHFKTWCKLRNSVMHGELVEPWSTEEGDQHMREMVGLSHSLTHVRVAKG